MSTASLPVLDPQLGAGGAVGELIRGRDWSDTPLGPLEHWPPTLRTVLSVVLSATQPMFVAWGPEHRLLYNDRYAEVLGERHPDALGRPFLDVWWDIAEDLQPLFQRLLQGEAIYMDDLLVRLQRHSRTEEAHFAFSWTPVRTPDGRIAGLFCACNETSEQVLEDRALRKAEEELRQRFLRDVLRLHRLFEQAPGLMAVLRGPDHVFELANRAYQRFVGPRELVGRPAREALPEVVEQGFVDLLDGVFRSGISYGGRDMRLLLRRSPQEEPREAWVDFIFQPIVDAAGQVEGIFVEGFDATERHQALQQLRDAEAQLERRVAERTEELAAANRQLLSQIEQREQAEHSLRQLQRLEAVGQLTAGVAHDFNNLLQIIVGNIGILRKLFEQAQADPRYLQRLESMATAAERGARLTAQLLAFSRRQRLEPKATDLNETVDAMMDLLHSSIGGTVHLDTKLQPGLWNALVDPTQIELVILNLALNARDAMDVGGALVISTRNERVSAAAKRPEEPAPGEYVVLAVADTGSGMAEEVRERVFEPFFTTKAVGKGSGLGLSQVLGFAKQSGGGVRLLSESGKGTTVEVFLPRAGSAPAAVHVPARLAAVGNGGDEHPHCILLVDDDDPVREVTAAMLEAEGYEVLEAGSGGAALERLASAGDRVDLLVVDFAMPGMNGIEVAREAVARQPGLPVLFITGFADHRKLGMGERQVIDKPFAAEDLITAVRAALAPGYGTMH